jgi:tRNA(fMet)-specific endonuclease VapC
VTVYMLDTNICSFLIRGQAPGAEKRLIQLGARHKVVISAVVYFELRSGALSKKAPKRMPAEVAAFVRRLTDIIPWDRDAAGYAALIYAGLAQEGRIISLNDAMIAGHAWSAGCTLVTNNTRHFKRVKGLEIEDWA